MRIALDATYSIGDHLSGVGVYSNEIIRGLATLMREDRITLAYRPHRLFRAMRSQIPPNCRHRPLWTAWPLRDIALFHGLNQRLPASQYRRMVTTFHDLFVITGEYSSEEFRQRFTRQAREAAARSDLIVAVSRFTARQVCDLLDFDESRIRVVPHGVHRPATIPSQSREKIVLHVGAIQKRKNIGRLVTAFERMPSDWRLILAGSAGYGASEIFRQIEASPVRNRIEVPGYVDHNALQRLYGRARIFAFPSLDEGFGIPVLEAMAWGVPVITSRRASLQEIGGDAAFYIDPFDEQELADALCRLAEDGDLRSRLVTAGREHVTSFEWSRAAESTLSVYRELLD